MTAAVTHCAKCSAELIGSRKFCTACGAPTVDPRATGSSVASAATAPSSARPASKPEPAGAYGAPPAPSSQVNPFAQTAVPQNSFRTSDYGPPPAPLPAAGQPPPSLSPRSPSVSPGSSVSPLAMSNVMSQADVLPDVSTASRPSPDASDAGRIPGTQAMPSVPNPPVAGAAESKKPQERTQVMSAVALPRPNAASASQPQPNSQPQPTSQPQPYGAPNPQAPYAAQSGYGAPVAQAAQPAPNPQAYAQAPYGHAAPHAPQAQAPAAPQGYGAPPSYGAPFPPGSRVLVTWADGRRYPGVVHQLSGNAHLVVFPDGQQHWVELPYLSPG